MTLLAVDSKVLQLGSLRSKLNNGPSGGAPSTDHQRLQDKSAILVLRDEVSVTRKVLTCFSIEEASASDH
jgi:hypothetical protein